MSPTTSLPHPLPIMHRVLAALAISGASSVVSWLCIERVHLIVTSQILTHQQLAIDTVVAGALCTAGALIALWYAMTSFLACLALGMRAAGRASDRLMALVHRLGPTPIRRLLGVGAAGVLVVALAATPASAGPTGFAPDNLGYSESASRSTPSETAPSEPAPSEPAPSESAPSEPAPSEPTVIDTPEPTQTPTPTDQAAAHTPDPSPDVSGPAESSQVTAQNPALGGLPDDTNRAEASSLEPAQRLKRVDLTAPAETPSAPEQSTEQQSTEQSPAQQPTPQPTPEQAPSHGAPAATSTYLVLAGDSLWTITESLLGAEATTQDIATQWPRLYQANIGLIGSDPDLINPGTALLVPDFTASEN